MPQNHFHGDVKSYYLQIDNEAVDVIINCIETRFDQLDYARYSSLESLLLTAILLQQDYHHDWETRHRKKAILKGQLELMFDFCKDYFDISQLT